MVAQTHTRLTRCMALIVTGAVACGDVETPAFTVGDIEFAAPAGSGEPNLFATPDGRVLLTWFEPAHDGDALRVATRTANGWSEPQTIVSGREFFVNWADFPSLVETTGDAWLVHWLEKTAASTYAYHVMLSRSEDQGGSWSDPVRVHRDASPTEHGFVSMVPLDDGSTAMVWLDGRNTGGHGDGAGAMTLHAGAVLADGSLGDERLVDDRICDCCQTSAVLTADGVVAAYRDRSEEEVRDIAVTRFIDGAWTEPYHVGDDNWVFPACPVNGPALAARERDVAIAWFTGANDDPSVQVAFSDDAAASFGSPTRVDGGDPLGRVELELLEDGSALVVWLERIGESARILTRRVSPSGAATGPVAVTETSPTRRSGFPRSVRVGDEVVFAWNMVGEDGGIRVATMSIH